MTGIDRARYADEEEEEEEEVDGIEKVHWQANETFKAITIWDHHVLPDPKQDHWIRGVEEWIVMADAVLATTRSILIDQDTCRWI
jgi:hypothetical protein